MKLEVKLEKRDAWVGLFWDRKPRSAWAERTVKLPSGVMAYETQWYELHVYVCPVPFVVFHFWGFGNA